MLLLANVALFQIAWLSSVIGGAREMPWLGPVTVAVALALHFRAARKPFEEILLVITCALIGAAFDSFLVAAGWAGPTSMRIQAALVDSSRLIVPSGFWWAKVGFS